MLRFPAIGGGSGGAVQVRSLHSSASPLELAPRVYRPRKTANERACLPAGKYPEIARPSMGFAFLSAPLAPPRMIAGTTLIRGTAGRVAVLGERHLSHQLMVLAVPFVQQAPDGPGEAHRCRGHAGPLRRDAHRAPEDRHPCIQARPAPAARSVRDSSEPRKLTALSPLTVPEVPE